MPNELALLALKHEMGKVITIPWEKLECSEMPMNDMEFDRIDKMLLKAGLRRVSTSPEGITARVIG